MASLATHRMGTENLTSLALRFLLSGVHGAFNSHQSAWNFCCCCCCLMTAEMGVGLRSSTVHGRAPSVADSASQVSTARRASMEEGADGKSVVSGQSTKRVPKSTRAPHWPSQDPKHFLTTLSTNGTYPAGHMSLPIGEVGHILTAVIRAHGAHEDVIGLVRWLATLRASALCC